MAHRCHNSKDDLRSVLSRPCHHVRFVLTTGHTSVTVWSVSTRGRPTAGDPFWDALRARGAPVDDVILPGPAATTLHIDAVDDPPNVARFYFATEDGWELLGRVARAGDELVISDLEIRPLSFVPDTESDGWPRPRTPADPIPSGGINASVLRSIRTGELVAKVRAHILREPEWIEWREGLGIAVSPEDAETARRAADAVKATPLRRGSRGYPDDHYRGVALEYLRLQAEGRSKGLLIDMAETYGRPRETIRDWVRGARERGFLSGGVRGKVGAEPGPNLYKVTDNEGDGQ